MYIACDTQRSIIRAAHAITKVKKLRISKWCQKWQRKCFRRNPSKSCVWNTIRKHNSTTRMQQLAWQQTHTQYDYRNPLLRVKYNTANLRLWMETRKIHAADFILRMNEWIQYLILGACTRVTVVLCVCYHANCYIPHLRVQTVVFLVVCGLRRKRFVGQFWRHLLILIFLTSFCPVLCYDLRIKYNIRHRPIIPMHARGLRGRGLGTYR